MLEGYGEPDMRVHYTRSGQGLRERYRPLPSLDPQPKLQPARSLKVTAGQLNHNEA